MRLLPLWLLIVACDVTRGTGDAGAGAGSRDPDLTTSVVGDDDDDDDDDVPVVDDVALVRSLIAGEASVDDVIPAIAWSGGFPVRDGDTLIFVHWYEGGDWAVAGDFNDWVPAGMSPGAGFWWAEVEASAPEGQGYKFVNGGADWVADPFARSYTYDEFGELSFVAPPTDRWRLDRWPAVEAEGLAPRDVRVYVPPGDGPFDVLYAQDGQNLFDPNAIWGGWRLQDVLGSDVLVVGIDNTGDRFNEYTHVDDEIYGEVIPATGDAYAALVHEVVRPHVENTYGSTGHDGLLGSSLGGLISLHIAWTYPDAYDFVASMSGTLGWGRFALENEAMEARWLASPPSLVVYVDSGGGAGDDGVCTDPDGDGYPEDDPDSSDNYCETRQFADALSGAGFTWDDTLFHWHEAGAQHNEMAWASRVSRPLEIFRQSR